MFAIAAYKIIALREDQWLGFIGGAYLLWLYFNFDKYHNKN
jgi:hypothetical protein